MAGSLVIYFSVQSHLIFKQRQQLISSQIKQTKEESYLLWKATKLLQEHKKKTWTIVYQETLAAG